MKRWVYTKGWGQERLIMDWRDEWLEDFYFFQACTF